VNLLVRGATAANSDVGIMLDTHTNAMCVLHDADVAVSGCSSLNS